MAVRTFMITLVRHGQTTHNKLKIIQGQMETQLTELGRDQAKLLRDYIEATKESFDVVYSSDLIRAYETCQIICNNKYDINKNQLIRERLFGNLQGLHLDELRKAAYKVGLDDSNYTQFKPEGGESIEEFKARIKRFCEEVLFPAAKDGQSILIVSHGGVIREFFKVIRDYGCQLTTKDLIISPNTGVSRFTVELDNANNVVDIKAKSLHQIPHLTNDAKSEALNEEQLNESGMKPTPKEEEHGI